MFARFDKRACDVRRRTSPQYFHRLIARIPEAVRDASGDKGRVVRLHLEGRLINFTACIPFENRNRLIAIMVVQRSRYARFKMRNPVGQRR